jgi:hypothetical protein
MPYNRYPFQPKAPAKDAFHTLMEGIKEGELPDPEAERDWEQVMEADSASTHLKRR